MSLNEELFSLQDIPYRQFQAKLIPNIDPKKIIGVRTPQLRHLARACKERNNFLDSLPHAYFEENQIHAFLLESEKDFDTVLYQVEQFLPFVDNWATCDQLRPQVFQAHHEELLPCITRWLQSSHPYTIRFGIEMLMCHFLDQDFRPEYPAWVASLENQDYYVKMMVAWYFATALAKQYNSVIPYISEKRLDPWIHRKTIQKAVESCRITPEHKQIIKQYR